MIEALAALSLTAGWLYMAGGLVLKQLRHKHVKELAAAAGTGDWLKRLLIIDAFAGQLERLKAFDTFQLPLGSYHMKLVVLNGSEWTLERTKAEAAACTGKGYAAFTSCAWLSLPVQEPLLLLMGAVFAVLLVVRPFIETGKRVELRKQQIIMELPNMLSQLMLLVGAGETVQQAIARCLNGKDRNGHPLYREWRLAAESMRNGMPFDMAIEKLNRRCAVQEVSIFTTVLLLNYRRGGEHFVLALRELSYTLWEKRKAIARTRGEQASSKLVFPMVGILLVLMVLVGAPAFLLMS
ncbi:type II secretion system F family protein [Paenibacillus vietnamensis]|uniref:type II secretion system F family protein n=1 Tax=Paenibacillus vietnamensis TaxID=2590547 RepID=UPI001CD112F6|nr:type II secretion system F family protein [Paenibacillus vietnamensis]